MKKYFLFIAIVSFLFAGCVKDEQPTPVGPAPVEYTLVINELMTKDITNPFYLDGQNDGADWIEIYNTGTSAINIGGMYITDNPGTPDDYNMIPTDDETITTIPPKGFLVLICGAADAEGNDVPTSIIDGKIFIDMGLSSSKDYNVALYDPNEAEIDKSGDFNGLEDDKSFGRSTDGSSEWIVLGQKTPGASNNGSEPTEGQLVVNEFMASNDNIPVPGDNGDFPDWIEIYNTGDTPIDMGGWYVTDDLEDMLQYQLPTDNPDLTTVPAHGYLILYCDGTGEGLHTNFKLGSGGEAIGVSADGVEFHESYTYCDTGCDLPNPPTDFSAGRNGDGQASWVVFDPESETPPTPGEANGIQK